jgi:hypothetical protein
VADDSRRHLARLLLGHPVLTTDLRGFARLIAEHVREEPDPELREAFGVLSVYEATVQLFGAVAREARELKRQGGPEAERADLTRLSNELRTMLRRMAVTGAGQERVVDVEIGTPWL